MRVRDIRILLAGPTSMESDASARSTTHPSLTSLLRDTEEVRHCCGDTRAKGTVKGMRLHNLEVFARNTEGELLSLRDSLEGSRVLRPAYEVESAPGLPDRRPERLVLVKGLLLSMRTVPAQASTCSAAPGTRVTAWKLQTGERMEVLLGRAIGEDPASKLEGPWPLIRDLCNSTSPVRLAF
eukprot:s59_g34.t1